MKRIKVIRGDLQNNHHKNYYNNNKNQRLFINSILSKFITASE